jgi:hypothetical protein
MYDKDLADIVWNEEEQCYTVWYNGTDLGTARSFKEAHEVIINHVAY